MWGIPVMIGLVGTLERIIPTYVGNTNVAIIKIKDMRDHPYVCGEYLYLDLV